MSILLSRYPTRAVDLSLKKEYKNLAYKTRRAIFENAYIEINRTWSKCYPQCAVLIVLSDSFKALISSSRQILNNKSFPWQQVFARDAPILKNLMK